jgi:uncharacterized SAM-binding protein YcdF (DUF218 family)
LTGVARPNATHLLSRGVTFALAITLLASSALVIGAGFVVEGRHPPLQPSDAIIVISGDEDQARLRAGLSLWEDGWAGRLIFSGAARAGPVSNAAAMRMMALEAGVPTSAILVDDWGADTYGNAVRTRQLMEQNQLHSGILVTSPYHLQRATLTFQSVFRGSNIRLIASSAPDSSWRKQSWWLRPDLRLLTISELEKLAYIAVTGRYN